MAQPHDPTRIHLLAHANPITPDIKRFGLKDSTAYINYIRKHLPQPYQLTCNQKLLDAEEYPWNGGRQDDRARIRDLQCALNDPNTLAIVAANGGGYFTRLLPHLNFHALKQRKSPLWTLGFSEMSTLVGLVASYRAGRGLYWLCPNWLAWRVKPADQALAAFAEFWHILPDILNETQPPTHALHLGPLDGTVVAGRPRSGTVSFVGGCLAVLAAAITGPLGRRLRPDGKWLFLEDIKESPYRIDRHLASLKLAGWFERAAGLLLGDFRMMHEDTRPAVLELLQYHLPEDRRLPIITTNQLGHVWPQIPLPVNQPLTMTVKKTGEVHISIITPPPASRRKSSP